MKPNTFMTGTANEYDDFFMVLYNFIFQCQKISLTKISTLWLSKFFVQKYTKI